MAKKRTKQTARKTTNLNVPARLRSGPPSYNELIREGGQRGDRNPNERAFIVKDYIFHLHVGCPLAQPTWFRERFLIYPAYKFTTWEISFVNLEPGFVTRAKFRTYFRMTEWINREQELAESTAYLAVESALASLPSGLLKDLENSREKLRSESEWESDSDVERDIE
eukprot:jgi/Botrbrau1/15046/Bobra.0297s0003.1